MTTRCRLTARSGNRKETGLGPAGWPAPLPDDLAVAVAVPGERPGQRISDRLGPGLATHRVVVDPVRQEPSRPRHRGPCEDPHVRVLAAGPDQGVVPRLLVGLRPGTAVQL